MGIYRESATATVSESVIVTHACEYCGHSHSVSFTVRETYTATGSGNATGSALSSYVEERARDGLERKIKSFPNLALNQIGLLCPSCGEFNQDSRSRYFRKGYRRGILQLIESIRRRCIRRLGRTAVLVVILLALSYPYAHYIRTVAVEGDIEGPLAAKVYYAGVVSLGLLYLMWLIICIALIIPLLRRKVKQAEKPKVRQAVTKLFQLACRDLRNWTRIGVFRLLLAMRSIA